MSEKEGSRLRYNQGFTNSPAVYCDGSSLPAKVWVLTDIALFSQYSSSEPSSEQCGK